MINPIVFDRTNKLFQRDGEVEMNDSSPGFTPGIGSLHVRRTHRSLSASPCRDANGLLERHMKKKLEDVQMLLKLKASYFSYTCILSSNSCPWCPVRPEFSPEQVVATVTECIGLLV